MATILAAAAAIAACKAINDLIEVGAGVASVLIYNGAKPASADIPVSTQVLLVDFDLPDNVFGVPVDSAQNAVAQAVDIAAVAATASGTAAWFRVINGDGNSVYDGSCSGIAGTGEMKLSSVDIIGGIEAKIVSWVVRMPKGN